jgi:MarR family transcriptional regulator for hemolysin
MSYHLMTHHQLDPDSMNDEHEKIRGGFGAVLAQGARLWRRAVDRRLEPYGLTEAHWLPLLRLARAPAPMRQKDLAASLSLDNSSVVRLLDALQQAGLIERQEDSDRRAKAIVLTASGRARVEEVEAVARQVREDALLGLTDQDLETTSRTLAHICRILAPQTKSPA